MASKLQVLHTRNLRAQAVSLSPASDLCVVVSTEGLISLYRTITLEKVWSKDIADIFQSSSAPTCAAFDHSGRAVAVGFRNGDIGVIDVESIQGAKAFNRNEGTAASITALSWLPTAST
jgi:WD40 repeat protein